MNQIITQIIIKKICIYWLNIMVLFLMEMKFKNIIQKIILSSRWLHKSSSGCQHKKTLLHKTKRIKTNINTVNIMCFMNSDWPKKIILINTLNKYLNN